MEFRGHDGNGGPPYIGTGCFHRRESLCGKKYSKGCNVVWKNGMQWRASASAKELEEGAKCLASCTCEENTLWGKEIGMKYGNPVEDVISGLAILYRGWKSIFLNPTRQAFLGHSPTTLLQSLVQHKRWGEGHLQVLLSKNCTLIQGHGKIQLPLQLSYCLFNAWAANGFPTLLYALLPSLALLKGISFFPKMSSPWFVPFAYVIACKYVYGLGEELWAGETLKSWWNQQRMWLYRRVASYCFSTIDTLLKLSGLGKSAFDITAKDTDEEVAKRYEQEKMEFGSNSPMFTVLATVAMVNLFCLLGAIKMVMFMGNAGVGEAEALIVQWVLCGALVIINWPIYEGLFLRKDNGRLPLSLAFQSISLALLVCLMPLI